MSAVSYPVRIARRQALMLIAAQGLATLLLALGWSLFGGRQAGWSALAGGSIAVLGTAYLAFAVLRQGRAASGAALPAMLGFVLGWAIKVLLTIGLLLVVFRSQVLQPLPVLVAFVVVNVVYWGVLLRAGSLGTKLR